MLELKSGGFSLSHVFIFHQLEKFFSQSDSSGSGVDFPIHIEFEFRITNA